jgi:hypothetical protein
MVLPIDRDADVSAYERGMPVVQFDSKVKALITRDRDSD